MIKTIEATTIDRTAENYKMHVKAEKVKDDIQIQLLGTFEDICYMTAEIIRDISNQSNVELTEVLAFIQFIAMSLKEKEDVNTEN